MEAAERERLSLEPLTSLTQLLGLAIIHLHENKHRCRYTDKHIYAYFIHLPTYIYSFINKISISYIHTQIVSPHAQHLRARGSVLPPPTPAARPPSRLPAGVERHPAPARARGRRGRALIRHEGEIAGRPLRTIKHQCKNETRYFNGVFMSG